MTPHSSANMCVMMCVVLCVCFWYWLILVILAHEPCECCYSAKIQPTELCACLLLSFSALQCFLFTLNSCQSVDEWISEAKRWIRSHVIQCVCSATVKPKQKVNLLQINNQPGLFSMEGCVPAPTLARLLPRPSGPAWPGPPLFPASSDSPRHQTSTTGNVSHPFLCKPTHCLPFAHQSYQNE